MTTKEYWNLIGQEPFLAITWELDFSQACSFRRMLMNHKTFHFTNISDKTHDVIFLKSPKNMFLGHFYPTAIFSKKIRLCHTIIYGPLTPCYVSEKTNEPIPRKLTDRRKDGRTEGRTNRLYFIGPFRKRPGVQLQQKRQKKKKMIK